MDFSGFEVVDNSHPRKGGYTLIKEQAYDNMKYRKAPKKQKDKNGVESTELEGRFYVANAKITELGLDDANGLTQFTNNATGETIFCLVADKDATILKKSKKGKKSKNFKSPKLEAALEKAGLIDSTQVKVNQYLDLTLVGENVSIKGVSVIKAFSFSKGVAKPQPVKAEPAMEAAAPVQAAAQTASAPAKKDDWS